MCADRLEAGCKVNAGVLGFPGGFRKQRPKRKAELKDLHKDRSPGTMRLKKSKLKCRRI